MNFTFDSDYFPPIPVIEIYLSLPDQSTKVGPLVGIIDTGADGTIIPTQYLTQLGSVYVDDASIRSQWGEERVVEMHMVDIRIGNAAIAGVYVVGDDLSNEIILGRNFLNKLRFLVDGPVLITKIMNL